MFKMMWDESPVKAVLVLLLLILLVVGSIWYATYQFNICYPEISDSWWYCFQHAT